MTQKAPERIITRHYVNGIINARPKSEGFVIEEGNEIFTGEYLHIDHALALLAAEREACANIVACQCQCGPVTLDKAIRTRTNADAQAALERGKQEARNEALRECLDVARLSLTGDADGRDIFDAINNLITEDQGDE